MNLATPEFDRPEIERIVRDVLRRIRANGTAATVDPAATSPVTGQPVATMTGRALELTGKVISLDQIEGKLAGVSQVTAGADAVVTPSVRDYLKQHDIRFTVRAVERTVDGNRCAQSTLWLASLATGFDIHGLNDDLTQQGIPCRVLSDLSLPAVSTPLARQLRDRATAIVLTGEVDVATCAMNRHPSIRGFVATDLATLTKAQQAIGGNLLIVDPDQCSKTDLREMACKMAQPVPAIPPQWRNIL